MAICPELAAAAAVFGIIAWFLRMQVDKNFKMRSLPFDIPVAIFVMLGAVSVFMSPARTFELIYNYCGIVGLFILTYILIGQNIRKPGQVKKLTITLAASAGIVVLYGYFQYIFGIDIYEMKWVDGEAFPELRNRVFSTLENPNVLAGYLDVMICLALGFLAKLGTAKQKLFIIAAIVMLMACLAMTYSRGAFLTIAIIFIFYGVLYNWRVLLLFAAGTGILFLTDENFFERVLSIFQVSYDSSEGLRVGIWVSTISMISDHPFIGIGWGAYKFIYPQYNYYLADTTQIIYHAHNIFLQTAAEVGIAGALAYFWYFFGTMFMALSWNTNESYNKVKNAAGEIKRRAAESAFQKKFNEEFAKTVTESKFLQTLAQSKSMMKIRLSDLTNQILDKFSPPKKNDTKTVAKKSEPELVHHEEMKWDAKTKNDAKNSDDDKIDIQKFAADAETNLNKEFLESVKFGIGLAFFSMALNGVTDDLLFNIPSSILMWMLGALAAAINLFDEEN